ncbi:MAG: sigma-70 family RNA polymerase sigma factor [Rhodoblastus sp.]
MNDRTGISRAGGAEAQRLAELLQRTGRRDQAAFRELYLATSAKLMGVVVRILRSRSDAGDVLQDVYLKVWTSSPGFAPENGSAMGWLISIARNRSIDIVRARTAAATDTQETDWFERLQGATDTEGEFMTKDALTNCLQRLNPRVRDAILLAYYEGLSREELADKLDMPVSSVKTWLRRGSMALRDCLEGKS